VPGSASLIHFAIAALVVLLIPGPGVLYVVTRSLSQGRQAGLISVLGLSIGALAQVAAATLGISAALVASATAFGVVKTLGAAYLVYLGIRAILSKPAAGAPAFAPRSFRRVFLDGVLVSVLNPKIAVFFLAFLPQFVEPGRAPIPQQVLCLGALYVALALVTDSTYALLAARLRGWLGSRVVHGRLPHYATGVVYVGLGVSTALTDRR